MGSPAHGFSRPWVPPPGSCNCERHRHPPKGTQPIRQCSCPSRGKNAADSAVFPSRGFCKLLEVLLNNTTYNIQITQHGMRVAYLQWLFFNVARNDPQVLARGYTNSCGTIVGARRRRAAAAGALGGRRPNPADRSASEPKYLQVKFGNQAQKSNESRPDTEGKQHRW